MNGSSIRHARAVEAPAQPPPGFWIAALVLIARQMGLVTPDGGARE